MSRERDLSTRSVHGGREANRTRALSMPIFQSSTFRFESAEEGARLCAEVAPTDLYTRWGNPTTRALEQTLADLEGGEAALAFASGMGAGSAAVMASVTAGDHVVAADCLYAGMTELFARVLTPLGIETTFVDAASPGKVEGALRDDTRLIYVETPANPTLAITDLEAVAALGAERGITTLADNTWASPVNQRPIELGIDGVVASTTKYLGGHTDVVGGVVVGAAPWIERVWYYLKILGACPSPNDAWLVLRGVRSLAVRVERQNETALALARHLEDHPKVSAVHYPGLAGHPGHATARRQMSGFGGMLAFDLAGGLEAGRKLLESLELVTHAVSLGGVETLAVHPASTTHGPLSREERERGGVTDGLIRMSVGLEAPADLVEDLDRGLARV